MFSVIIYAATGKHLDRTVDGLLDSATSIDEIIVCCDGDFAYERKGIIISRTAGVGRARAWNIAADQARGSRLLFLRSGTKFHQNWLDHLMDEDQSVVVSPIINSLDEKFWSTEDSQWQSFGWRWDLNIYNRGDSQISPAVSAYCISVDANWFRQIGRFDDGMRAGGGEDVEFSIRHWLMGGSIRIADSSRISVVTDVESSEHTLGNLARIVEAWMPNYAGHFYAARGIKPQDVRFSSFNNLLEARSHTKRSIEWYLNTLQPELVGVYDLRGTATGKSVAVVAPGPSLDYINPAMIYRHDIVIGVDYAPLEVECDYVLSDDAGVVSELLGSYPAEKCILPMLIKNWRGGQYTRAEEIAPGCIQFERAGSMVIPESFDPPFCDFDNNVHTAVHLALFLGAQSVTVFGCDNKLVGGRSHSAKIEAYDGGRVLPDSETTRRRFAVSEYGFDQLGKLGNSAEVPILRVGHA